MVREMDVLPGLCTMEVADDQQVDPQYRFTRILFDLNDSKAGTRASIAYQFKPGESLALSAGLHSKPEHLSTYYFKNTNHSLACRISISRSTSSGQPTWCWPMSAYLRNIRVKAEAYYQHLYKVPVEKDMESEFSMLNAGDVYGLVSVDSALVSKGEEPITEST